MVTRGIEDSEYPVSQSTASSEDLLPCCEQQRRSPSPSEAADVQQQAHEEENLDDLLELLQDSDDDSSAVSAPAPPPKRARRLPGWMASAAPPLQATSMPATAAVRKAQAGPSAPNRAGSSIAGRQMALAFEQDQAKKRREVEDAKASAVQSSTADNAAQRLMGALVDPEGTATSASRQPGRTVLTRALFPRRVVIFDVETTGFRQDDVIVEIGGVELVDGVRTVSPCVRPHLDYICKGRFKCCLILYMRPSMLDLRAGGPVSLLHCSSQRVVPAGVAVPRP